jgi:hypothetical protein
MKYDTNRDGTFSLGEVEEIVRDVQTAQKEARNYRCVATGVSIIALLLLGVLLGLMYAANGILPITNLYTHAEADYKTIPAR